MKSLAYWLLLAAPAAMAAPPQLEVRLDPQTITVGDRVWATLEVTVDAGSPAPTFPTLDKTWGEAEILGREPVGREDAGSGRVRYRQRLALTAFRTGPLKLPAVTLGVPPSELTTPPELTLQVESVLPGESAADAPLPPRPPQPPRPLPIGTTFWWSLGGGLGLLALALLIAARGGRRIPGLGAPAAPLLAPWPELLAGLSEAGTKVDPEAVHVALSAVLRRYLGRTFSFPALESTSTEIRCELDRRRTAQGCMARDAKAKLLSLLDACDQVKFARAVTDAATAKQRLRAARDAAGELEAQWAPALPPGAPLTGGAGSAGGTR